MRHKTLIDLLEHDLKRDPCDAPAVYLEADVMADDMARYAPASQEPELRGRMCLSDVPAPAA